MGTRYIDVAACNNIHWIQWCFFHLDVDLNTLLLFMVGLVQDTENEFKKQLLNTLAI